MFLLGPCSWFRPLPRLGIAIDVQIMFFPRSGTQAVTRSDFAESIGRLERLKSLLQIPNVFLKIYTNLHTRRDACATSASPPPSTFNAHSPHLPLLFWWLTLALVMFLLTPLSLPVWKTFVFPFGLIQYPWRWLGIAALATAMIVSGVFVHLKDATVKFNVIFIVILLAWLAFSSMQYLPWQTQEVDVARHPVQMWEEDAANKQVGATWTAEFLPLTVKEQRWALAGAPEVIEASRVGERSPLRVLRAGGDGFTLWAEVEATEAGWLAFPRFAYPSMAVTVSAEGGATDIKRASQLEPVGIMGLAGVQVPAGRHRVTLDAYPLANKWWLSWAMGLLSLALVAYGALRCAANGACRAPLLLLVILPVMGLLFFLTRQPDVVTSFEPPFAFSEQAQLVAVRHSATALQAGEVLPVRLLWFNLVQTNQFYSTFIHLTPAGGGAPLVLHDGQPNMNTVPTPRWLPGQLVEDLHLLSLPEDLPPGEYELWGGIYAVQDGAVLPIAGDSGERRFLGVVEVK